MCAVSMIGDYYQTKWNSYGPNTAVPNAIPGWTTPITSPSQYEFDALKKEVEQMKELLKRAKKYDEDNGEPNCEMADKVAVLKRVAELVGVSLDEIFPK